MKFPVVTALALILSLSLPARAENGEGKTPPVPEAVPPEAKADEPEKAVDGLAPKDLIPLLGHARYKMRQAAEERLKDLVQEDPESVGEACYQAYSRDADPEIRMRARSVLLGLVTKSGSTGGRGFVGIRLHLHAFFSQKGELHFAIKVNQVEPGTPASQAGLLGGDLVTSVDAVDLNNPDGDRKFMDYVARKPPGKQVVLSIDRAGKVFKQTITLARRPPETLVEESTVDPESLFREFLRKKESEKQAAAPAARPAGKESSKPKR